MPSLKIDVFSDVVCPWCFIGTRRLHRALASFDPPVDVTIRHHPFLLDPDTPAGGVNIAERLREKYGRDPQAMFATVEAAAQASGIPLDLSKQPFSYPTVAAHTLLRHAADPVTQLALADALFVAHFLDARNIADPDVLVDIASRHGFEPAVARRLLEDEAELEVTRTEAGRAAASGIRGVPFFVFDNRLAVSGGQREEVFRDAIQQALATAGGGVTADA
jgi:predicted DsbA family dithiol-disulfide isomerase